VKLPVTDTPSPNFNERKRPVSLIVLHYTGMKDGPSALARMRDKTARVSAHYMVEEDGRIFRLVAEDKRAWHAGLSYWRGERDVNSASIGIEIVNGGHDHGSPPFPDAQIDTVIVMVRTLRAQYGLPPQAVVGHSDVAPGRKIDPGEGFPWERLAAAGCALALPQTRKAGEPAALLKQIGYTLEPGLATVVEAFQRRWRPSRVDGKLDEETRDLVARVASAA
jgi:N-acetylmuramoyl-L-alanine amidase